ncbi:hypothetical protein HaLaN_17319 [Haematococcus lacustris]|uniref:Uncharacterized protein n=1 Tax=Haematococcus lacustris TaxID=44745 RepID=A0A699ZGA4_HAELA|nr:hypothetical protein HaLaN_17319 [Haematococcus lacustris]
MYMAMVIRGAAVRGDGKGLQDVGCNKPVDKGVAVDTALVGRPSQVGLTLTLMVML